MSSPDLSFLTTLEKIIGDRKASPVEGSYTCELFASGKQRIAQKVGEEAIELALASVDDDLEATINESADLLYHLLVLLTNQGIRLSDITARLEQRHSVSISQLSGQI